MYYDRDEFMLLSRTGRVPPATRAGPRSDEDRVRHRADCLAARSEAGILRRMVRALAWRRPAPAPADGGRDPRRAQAVHGYADRDSYLELEFAVGFGIEDEKLP